MPSGRFYVPPIDPGWGRVGEALAGGIGQGVNNFVQMRQLREDRRRQEDERQRARGMEEARFNSWLADRYGGRGAVPTRTVATPVEAALGARPSVETQAPSPTGDPIRLMTSVHPAPNQVRAQVPDDRFVQVLPDRPGAAGAYVATPEYRQQVAQGYANREREQGISDALLVQATTAGVDPGPFTDAAGNVDSEGLRAAVAAANSRRRSGSVAQWQVRRAEDRAVWPIAQKVYDAISRADPRPPGPADRPFYVTEAQKAVQDAGLPATYVPLVVDMIYRTYGNVPGGFGTQAPDEAGTAIADLISEFGDSPQGVMYGIPGRAQTAIDQWLSGAGSLAIRMIAARYGIDPAAIEAQFRQQMGTP